MWVGKRVERSYKALKRAKNILTYQNLTLPGGASVGKRVEKLYKALKRRNKGCEMLIMAMWGGGSVICK